MTLPVETLKSVTRGKAVWNANGGFVSVLLTHLFLFLFGQRFLDNPRADSRQILHAGVLWFRVCLLPFCGLAPPPRGGAEKGGNVEYEWRVCVSSTDALVILIFSCRNSIEDMIIDYLF